MKHTKVLFIDLKFTPLNFYSKLNKGKKIIQVRFTDVSFFFRQTVDPSNCV